jgi:ankyrin repeat protein
MSFIKTTANLYSFLINKGFHWAIENDHKTLLKGFTLAGADLNQVVNGSTALHKAVLNNNAQMINLLIESGAILTKGDKNNRLPLDLAGKHKNEEIRALLLKHHEKLLFTHRKREKEAGDKNTAQQAKFT